MTALTHLNTGHAKRCFTFMTQFWLWQKLLPFNISPTPYVLYLSKLDLVFIHPEELHVTSPCKWREFYSSRHLLMGWLPTTFYFVAHERLQFHTVQITSTGHYTLCRICSHYHAGIETNFVTHSLATVESNPSFPPKEISRTGVVMDAAISLK